MRKPPSDIGRRRKRLESPVPREEYKKELLFDGISFDPGDPEGYIRPFKIRRI
ncbi:MAG: hypothetical protein HY282_09675 [Nitrospirae bacterium]|nr:hypothetical protein [Candidatus Manganitrophaceae bacterium]